MKAVMASGLVRDGMALELVDTSADVVAEVFYSDVGGEMVLSAYRRDLLLKATQCLIVSARPRLPPRPGRSE
jgi:hypothetical protein